jgi:alkanesulfonate monooxygenase SsuD/methylene tetrahydromethanopterin reductase-like flavin-dependent oxidoreductase (luciferase family)
MLRVVAKHADIWHTFAEGADFARKSAVLESYCREIGRDPAEIERSVLVAGDPVAVGEPLLVLGATLFVVSLSDRPNRNLGSLAQWLNWRDQRNESPSRS